jgi:transcriptional regulator with XRE-family HTH domain
MTNLRALLANNIKRRREVLGISQAKLAEKVGTSTQYIGQIEQQNKFPSSEMLEKIATALNFDSSDLFSVTQLHEEALKQYVEAVKNVFNAANITFDVKIEELAVIKGNATVSGRKKE